MDLTVLPLEPEAQVFMISPEDSRYPSTLERTTVIELDGLRDPIAKAFLISVLLQKIRNYRLGQRERDT